MTDRLECKICGRNLDNYKSMSNHIRLKHNLNIKNYYDMYLKEENEDSCLNSNCENLTNFVGLRNGYQLYCSDICNKEDIKTECISKVNRSDPIECKICGRWFDSLPGLNQHLAQPSVRKDHNIKNSKDYYDMFYNGGNEEICNLEECNNGTKFRSILEGYQLYCSYECYWISKRRQRRKLKNVQCQVCFEWFENYDGLSRHLIKTHDIDKKDYYDTYLIKNKNEQICELDGCNKLTNLCSLKDGYNKYCSLEHYWEDPKRIERIKQSNIETFANHKDEIVQKSWETWIANHGDHPMRIPKFVDEFINSCINNLGVIWPMKSKKVLDGYKNTCLDKYGFEFVNQHPDYRQSNSEKALSRNWPKNKKIIDEFNLELLNPEFKGAATNHDWKCKVCNTIFRKSLGRINEKGYGCPKCNPKPGAQCPSKPQMDLYRLCQEVLPYPILEYRCLNGRFIDIAIPVLSLAIEYDEPYWHQNIEDDQKRQEELEDNGWNFLRYIKYIPTRNELLKDVINLLEGSM